MFYVFNLKKTFKILKFVIIFLLFFILAGIIISTLFPLKYFQIIDDCAKKYNLEPALICAVINVESGFDEKAVSKKGASGLMQLMKPTADWIAEINHISEYSYDDIFNPNLNINLGSYYLSRLMRQHDNNLTLVLASYNAGSGNVNKWLYDNRYSSNGKLTNIPFKETERYVKKVSINKKIYNILIELFYKN